MRRLPTEEEKELRKIYKPYMDSKTFELRPNAPKEAREALEKARKIAKQIRYEFNFG
ncbi:MAG: hypothetical protein J6M17_10315 [Ruminococcus sp.]|nr:hypothetical protein [Ruminococcus sp.]